MFSPVIELKDLDVTLDSKKILSSISWTLSSGERWAIAGPNGSGKTTFLKLIKGDIAPEPHKGRRLYFFNGVCYTSPLGLKERISYVSPELFELYKRLRPHLTAEEAILTGLTDSIYLYELPAEEKVMKVGELAFKAGLGDILKRDIMELSEGELMKIMILRALIPDPVVLILDEPLNSLDRLSRSRFLNMIESLLEKDTSVIFTTHNTSQLPSFITHLMILRDGRIVYKGEKKMSILSSHEAFEHNNVLDYETEGARSRNGDVIIDIKDVDVYLGDSKVLHNINWQIHEGENWAITGKNGSGKSTLLRLIAGDIHPAGGGRVRRFGIEEMNLWEIRKRMGYFSSEFQSEYVRNIKAEEVIYSGLYGSNGLYREVTDRDKEKAHRLMDTIGISHLRGKEVNRLSHGELRILLIARALVNDPRVLILDEPFNGLDAFYSGIINSILYRFSLKGRNIIVSTHDERLPSYITDLIVIESGKIVEKKDLC